MTIASTLTRTAIMLGLAVAPAAAFAQSGTTASDPAGAQTPDTAYSDAELQSFVDATVKVQEVRSGYLAQIEAADTDADKQEIAQEANQQMAAAVEATGEIDLATYNEIGQAAQADPALNDRIVAMLQQSDSATPTDNEG
ncbi:DUF4168 domain-containing protein [Pseudooceanicola sp. C21-150M6]|uniref:DUF4168 domain-containing protein n=1 Tax=Pseudooceanicola sp. C21-150M6 TaxID=3434355 RepID=UPI003D7F3422